MTPERWSQVKRLAEAALELPAHERAAYLHRACGADAPLRADVEAILAAAGEAPEFFERPAAESFLGVASASAGAALIGRRFGAYEVVRPIASGGMGAVYLGRRADEQFQKDVAIKFIKCGFLDGDAGRRLTQERQTLANLDHPNIAKLLDGGMTAEGLPYLVMEYVPGQPINQYCDEQRRNTHQRLELFRTVCAAVQYAHQNLIVHRDLKPGNIFVTADGVPKLLDFGIAKVLDEHGATGPATQTLTMHRCLTPEYASPEQIRGEPITTATDVYSLGVVLYELLTGQRPFQAKSGALHDLARTICEQEPVKPSTAVRRTPSQLGGSGSGPAPAAPLPTRRRPAAPPEKLRRHLAGDIDAIVLTALRKERQRRYASVEQLSEDIRRHLEGLPVLAQPSTLRYRATKFIRRHKTSVAAAVVVAASLVAAVIATTWAAQVARQERNVARVAERRAQREAENARVETLKSKRVTEFLQKMLTAADPSQNPTDVSVRQLLDEAAQRVAIEFAQDPEVESAVRIAIGQTYVGLGRYDEAETQLRRAVAIQETIHGGDHEDVANALGALAVVLYARGRYPEAELAGARALDIHRSVYGEIHADVATDVNNLGAIVRARGDLDRAEPLYRQALELRRRLFGEEHLDVAETLNNLAILVSVRGDVATAEALCRQVLAVRRKLLPARHPLVAQSLDNLAATLSSEQHDEAIALHREALALYRELLGNDHPDVATTALNLGMRLVGHGEPPEAEPLLRESIRIRRQVFGESNARVAVAETGLGRCLTALGRFDEAEPPLLGSYERLKAALGETSPRTREALAALVNLYERSGRPDAAAPYRAIWDATTRPSGGQKPD